MAETIQALVEGGKASAGPPLGPEHEDAPQAPTACSTATSCPPHR